MKIWTVDAFTDKLFTGNPAAVILAEEFPSPEMCQKIAAEINLPATAFVKPINNHTFSACWFSPQKEVKLCGHGTLAASHVLFQEGYGQNEKINYESPFGSLAVERKKDHLVLDFPLLKAEDKPFPLETFSTFPGFENLAFVTIPYGVIIAEFTHESDVRTLIPDFEKIKTLECEGLIVTSKGKAPYDFVSRVFGPRKGIPEDHVTGSAHCLLADYWGQKIGKTELLAYQASPRGGVLDLKIVGDRVHMKSQAVTVIEGTLRVGL